jgi:putative transposase
MATEGLSVQMAARVLDVSVSGFYEWKTRSPSARSIRHALLTEAIREVHSLSRGTYGFRRVHAEPTLGRGLTVGHGTVDLLMARAAIKGVTGRPRWVRARPTSPPWTWWIVASPAPRPTSCGSPTSSATRRS